MKKQLRLDKYLSDSGYGTRSEIKKLIKTKVVFVNDSLVTDSSYQVNLEDDTVKVNDKIINYQEYYYFMLNKPSGYVSATVDNFQKTVLDLIHENIKDLYPVGRLDIDTEGLLIITNDGPLGHDLLSPKKHIEKTYNVILKNDITSEQVEKLTNGVLIDDYQTKPSIVKIVSDKNIHLTIYEGKFHQVKKMAQAVGNEVTYLQRLKMGTLELDKNLELGSYRPLTIEEINYLKNHK